MRLCIQIPCYNEAQTLPITLATIPQGIEGIDEILIVVIDDGSTDGTHEVAREQGVDVIVRQPHNRGLAAAFQTGLLTCLELGADVIVNTDADNQYPQADIGRLIQPIVAGQADMCIGVRQFETIRHFSPPKRFLQRLGSGVVSQLAGFQVPDVTSGYRALSREAALRLNIFTDYTYMLETIIQAGKKGLVITHVPIAVNEPTRQSRLMKSTGHYLTVSIPAIVGVYVLYKPFRFFLAINIPFLLTGLVMLLRYLVFFFQEDSGHVQSVIVGGSALTIGFLIFLFGIIAHLVGINRLLLEKTFYEIKTDKYRGEVRR